jgi:hypothetical protein
MVIHCSSLSPLSASDKRRYQTWFCEAAPIGAEDTARRLTVNLG